MSTAKDRHKLMRGRALLGGAGCGGLAESVGRLIQDARLYAGFLELAQLKQFAGKSE